MGRGDSLGDELKILLGGFFFGWGGGFAQGIFSIFRGFCSAQINIPYILNIS